MKRILKIIFLNISLIFFLNISFAEISYIEIDSKGKAAKYEDALKKALKEAVSKVNGVTIKTESVLEIIDKSLTTNEGSSATLGRNLKEKISEKSGGSIKSFDILNEYEDARETNHELKDEFVTIKVVNGKFAEDTKQKISDLIYNTCYDGIWLIGIRRDQNLLGKNLIAEMEN